MTDFEIDDRPKKIEGTTFLPATCWKDYRTHHPGRDSRVRWFACLVEVKAADRPNKKMLAPGQETFLEFAEVCFWNDLANRFQEESGSRDYLEGVRYWTELPAWPR